MGVVVIGDYNLVGSRTPIDILVNTQSPGLRHWMLPNLIGESVVTWRWDGARFPPGLLDLVTYGPGQLVARNGFVLDTGLLNQKELNRLGVKTDDSSVRDHLLLVADFGLSESE